MDEIIAERLAKDLGIAGLGDILSQKLSGSQLHSLLLGVLKRRLNDIKPFALTAPNAVTVPCDLDGRLLNRVEHLAYQNVPDFESLELSPLAPFGAVSILAKLDLGNVLSTIRAFECASDPTIGMALESARRRKDQKERKNLLRLCTNQRVVRFPVPNKKGFTAHFKLFSLVSAGRDGGSFSFESAALKEHIQSYLSFIKSLEQAGFVFDKINLELAHTGAIEYLCQKYDVDREDIRSNVRVRDAASSAKIIERYKIDWPEGITDPARDLDRHNLPQTLVKQLQILQRDVCLPLQEQYPQVQFGFNMHRLTGLGYYRGPCFHLKAQNKRGETFMLADGGFVDWTQTLLSDHKERLMTSAIGTELLCRMFR